MLDGVKRPPARTGERQRDRIDGEIPTQQVLLYTGGLDDRQRSRFGIPFAPSRGKVVTESIDGDCHGSEPVVRLHPAAEQFGNLPG